MAIIGIAFGTGFIIGPAIGGICYSIANNFSIAGFVGAGLSLASLIITQLFLIESKEKTKKAATNIINNLSKISTPAMAILSVTLSSMIIFSGFETSFSIYTEQKFGFNESNNSLLFFIIGIAAFVIQGSFTKISIQPINKAISIGLACIGVGLIGTNIISHLIPSLLMLTFLLFGMAILNTHLPAELSTTTINKGFILGIYESIGSIARIIGPLIIFTTLFHQLHIIYIILGGTSLLTLIIFQLIKHINKDKNFN